MAHQLVAYGTAVNIKELLIHLTTIVVGESHPAVEPQIVIAFVDVDRIFNEIRTDNPGQPIQRISGRQHQRTIHSARTASSSRLCQRKSHIHMRQTQPTQHLIDLTDLCALGFQKFTAGWRVIEQVAHFHGRTLGMRRRARILDFTAMGFDKPPTVNCRGSGGNFYPGHRGHTGQGLTSKTQAIDANQVVSAADFAGGMSLEG